METFDRKARECQTTWAMTPEEYDRIITPVREALLAKWRANVETAAKISAR